MGGGTVVPNGGDAAGAGGGASGGSGDGTGAGAPGDGAGGEGTLPTTIDRAKLNPVLQRMNAEEINELMDTMVSTIATKRTPAEPVVRREVAPPPPPPDYREMFDPHSDKFNPQGAVADIANRNFGGLIQDISNRANAGVFAEFRNEYHDFKEYEPDIRQLISSTGLNNPSREQINGLYLAAKGYKITMKERSDRAAIQTRPPTPPRDLDTPKPVDLEPGEETIARRMFRDQPDPIKAYREYVERLDSGNNTMKVPMSGGVRR